MTYIFGAENVDIEDEEVPGAATPDTNTPNTDTPEGNETETPGASVTPSTPTVPETPSAPSHSPSTMEIGEKTAERINDNDRWEVSINVPGQDGEQSHDEVILMVDGSYSGDTEWPAMKNAINAIGEAVLNGSGNTQLTLMAFGMGDNEVLVHIKDANDLAAALGELPGNLLRGVSSTNCEAGFTGVDEYIKNHDETLNEVQVIYITDGGINTDETPRLFYNWREYAPNKKNVIGYAIDGVDEATLLDAVASVIDDFAGTTREEADAAIDAASEAKVDAIVDYIWAKVFTHSNMLINGEYPISEMERAFLQYSEDYKCNVNYSFLLAMKSSKFDKYPNVWQRTYDSVFALAANEAVADLYLVRYQDDGRATWMPDAANKDSEDKIHYVKSDSIATLCEALQGALTDLAKTPFNGVYVTDYMSKWVNLDETTLKIVDNSTGETVWSAAEGWLTENRPTAQDVPVVVELVDPADYAAGGDDVAGNTNGDIYKLTWYVKDGAMLRADTYSLKYEVTVDVEEEGFVSNKGYPANGNTDLHYKDENGADKSNEIDVPDVQAEKPEPPAPPTISFNSGEASNISFMLIDKATGEVQFLNKVDIGGETSFEIPTEEGKVSAVFVKQSTSGMFWFSEETEYADAAIDCLKANNPSYKDHNTIAYGAGEHKLEFKAGKFATYTFAGMAEGSYVAIPYETETVAEEPVIEETPVEEPSFGYAVKGAEAASCAVVGEISAIYVAEKGKVPAVIWTSEEVEDLTEIKAELGVEGDAEYVFEIGDHDIEYQHNKNKTKTVTYTFEAIN